MTSTFSFPDRAGSMTGTEFGSSILGMPLGEARELAILQQYQLGNVPDFMKQSAYVTVSGGDHTCVFEVLPDVLCVGTDSDFLRTPMNPRTAQQIADMAGATLITPFMSDQVWKQAAVKLAPAPLPPSSAMTSTEYFIQHNQKVEQQRAGRCGLVAGHKKDVVLADTLMLPTFFGNRVAIYGWHELNGKPIQGLNPALGEKLTHEITYADYSHGIRLIAYDCVLDGVAADVREVMSSSEYGMLFNETGPLRYLRYPTV